MNHAVLCHWIWTLLNLWKYTWTHLDHYFQQICLEFPKNIRKRVAITKSWSCRVGYQCYNKLL